MIYRYVFFFFNETGTPEIYPDCTTLSLHDARPICEASDGLALAGGGGAARLGRYGVLSAAGALSETRAVRGRQLSLGHSWSNGRITTDLNSVRASGGYRDLASRDSRPPPRASDRALLGVGFERGRASWRERGWQDVW